MDCFLQKHPEACLLGIHSSAIDNSRHLNAELDSSAEMLYMDIEESSDRSLQLS